MMSNIELDEVRVYAFYVKGEKDLYAYTLDRKTKNRFLKERNPDCFHIEKIDMDELEFGIFGNINKYKKLEELPISLDKENHTLMLMTQKEDQEIEVFWNKLEHEIADAWRVFNGIPKLPLKKKYREAIEYIASTSYDQYHKNGQSDLMSSVNVLAIMTHLFFKTFEREKDET